MKSTIKSVISQINKNGNKKMNLTLIPQNETNKRKMF